MEAFKTWLRGVGWWIVLTWHQLVCNIDCGFGTIRTEQPDGAVVWCKTCDKTWSRP